MEFTAIAQRHALHHNPYVTCSEDAYIQWGEFADNPYLNPESFRQFNQLRLGFPYVCRCGKPSIPRGDYEVFYCLDCNKVYADRRILDDEKKKKWAITVAIDNLFCKPDEIKTTTCIEYVDIPTQISLPECRDSCL